MIGGCLRNVFALVGCGTVLAVGGVAAYQYRAQIGGAVRSVVGRAEPVARADARGSEGIGRPSDAALRSARRKQTRMARAGGPAYVELSPDEMASLLQDGLDPAARAALDSVRVVLAADRFALRASLLTGIFGRDLLGPFEGLLRDAEPLEVAGPAEFTRTGILAWRPERFRVRAFPFPRAVVSRLVNRLTGRSDGAVPIVVPGTVGDVRIRATGVTFYRRTD